MHELRIEINLTYEETSDITDYLIGEGLIAPYGLGGTIQLTHDGIMEMEEALDSPEKATEHFLPSIINIGTMNNSSVQQGDYNTIVNQIYNNNDIKQLSSVIEQIVQLQTSLSLSTEKQQELESELITLQSQQKSPKPQSIIIKESLKSIRTILEGVAGNVLAPAVIAHISSFLQ